MPRCLVIDWDQDRCNILEGIVTRAGVKIERSVAWAQEEVFNLAQGEEAGKKLKEFLKSANLAPAPLLACLPKQRILLKELRCPSVAEADEPAMVRFQGTKELLENPDDVVLDYSLLSRTSTDSLILLTAMRKDLLAGYSALAKGAGLKLLAVVPRPFVLADLLARCRKIDPVPPGPAPEWSAVLVLGGSWAELTILHGKTVCFARSMANDEAVDSEVRRSLAMFATQVQGHAPQILYLFGNATAELQERLSGALRIPVTRPTVQTAEDAGGNECPAAVGLLVAWGEEKVPVNFVKPKEPKPPAPTNHRAWILAAGGAVVLLAFFMLLSQQMLANTKSQIAEAKEGKDKIEKQLKGFEQERMDMDALEDWELGTVPWIDEFHDIAARFPLDPPGFHLTKLEGNVKPRSNTKDKEKYQARVILTGVKAAEGQRERFQQALIDPHSRVTPQKGGTETFTIFLDLSHQPASKYLTHLEVPKKPRPIAPPQPPADEKQPVAVAPPPGREPVVAAPPAAKQAPPPPIAKGPIAKKKVDPDDDDDDDK